MAFNIVLHFIYEIPCEKYGPDIATISRALDCLPKYGLSLPPTGSDIWDLLLRQAPSDPFRVYAIGASIPLDSLCILASQYTLNTSPSTVTEADALTMGPIYLRRLSFLHLGRQEALRRVLKILPDEHLPTVSCPRAAQNSLRWAWQAAIGEILLQELPQNTSAGRLSSTFGRVSGMTTCVQCKENVQTQISRMMQSWAMVRQTI